MFRKKCGVGNLWKSSPRPATENVHMRFSYTHDVAMLRQQPFSYRGGGGGLGFFLNKYFNARADGKKIRFCIVAKKKNYAVTG